jgi:hypothetical protein
MGNKKKKKKKKKKQIPRSARDDRVGKWKMGGAW